jgi:hypothetical protein
MVLACLFALIFVVDFVATAILFIVRDTEQ